MFILLNFMFVYVFCILLNIVMKVCFIFWNGMVMRWFILNLCWVFCVFFFFLRVCFCKVGMRFFGREKWDLSFVLLIFVRIVFGFMKGIMCLIVIFICREGVVVFVFMVFCVGRIWIKLMRLCVFDIK